MRFHLIDRVDAWEPARSVRARKLTSRSETYWEDAPDGPTMPGPLVLEALCQAGTWLIMLSTETRKRAALLSIADVRFEGEVRPGDVIELVGAVESMSEEVAVLSGTAHVDGRLVMRATDIMCALIDVAELEDVDATRRTQSVLDRTSGTPTGGR